MLTAALTQNGSGKGSIQTHQSIDRTTSYCSASAATLVCIIRRSAPPSPVVEQSVQDYLTSVAVPGGTHCRRITIEVSPSTVPFTSGLAPINSIDKSLACGIYVPTGIVRSHIRVDRSSPYGQARDERTGPRYRSGAVVESKVAWVVFMGAEDSIRRQLQPSFGAA